MFFETLFPLAGVSAAPIFMGIQREQPSLRDIFAAQIAGELARKSDLQLDSDTYWRREMKFHDEVVLRTIAFISYRLADKLIEERARED